MRGNGPVGDESQSGRAVGSKIARIESSRWNVERVSADERHVGTAGVRRAQFRIAVARRARRDNAHDIVAAIDDRGVGRRSHLGIWRVELEILSRADVHRARSNDDEQHTADDEENLTEHGDGLGEEGRQLRGG